MLGQFETHKGQANQSIGSELLCNSAMKKGENGLNAKDCMYLATECGGHPWPGSCRTWPASSPHGGRFSPGLHPHPFARPFSVDAYSKFVSRVVVTTAASPFGFCEVQISGVVCLYFAEARWIALRILVERQSFQHDNTRGQCHNVGHDVPLSQRAVIARVAANIRSSLVIGALLASVSAV